MKKYLEQLVNDIAMYPLLVAALAVITSFALLLSAIDILPYSLPQLLGSLGILAGVSYLATKLLAWTFSAQPNRESWLITALILFFLIPPVTSVKSAVGAAVVALLAAASKYILATRGKHLFNPAAIAVVIAGLLGVAHATWWVATPLLLPVTAIVGICIIAKTRRYQMVGMFLLAALVTSALVASIQGFSLSEALLLDVTSAPLIFFATIMLTEPLTAPSTRKWQLLYAGLIGILYSSQLPWLSAPASALVIGNLFAYLTSLRYAPRLRLDTVRPIAQNIYQIITHAERPLQFTPGQYVEITVPHPHADSRGIRRTFSIASAPHERTVEFGIALSDTASSFKQALRTLPKDTPLRVTQLGGDFVLPSNRSTPLVFLAGGIGITPFRSMLAHLTHLREARDIILFYAANTEEALAYQTEINAAVAQLQITYIPVIAHPTPSWQGETGFITAELIRKYVDNLPDRDVYISGPPMMVDTLKPAMKKAGAHRVVTDYFSGY